MPSSVRARTRTRIRALAAAAAVPALLVAGYTAAPASSATLHAPAVSFLAGTGTAGSTVGPGRVATGSQIGVVSAVGDADGNTYLADATSCRVRKVDLAGLISDIAGTTCGYGGDGGPALSASFRNPGGIWRQPNGDLYIADTGNCLIRKITAAGTVSTVAGVVPVGGVVQCGSGADGGSATASKLQAPNAVSVAPNGDVYIADTDNCRIRRVSGGTITLFAGTGTCGFNLASGAPTSVQLNHPLGVVVDSNLRVYISDSTNNRVREVSGGTLTTLVGTGTAGFSADGTAGTSAMTNKPWGISVDGAGQVFFADSLNCRVRFISYLGGSVQTAVGPPTAVPTPCGAATDRVSGANEQLASGVRGAAVTPGGDLLVSDTGNNRVEIAASAAQINTSAGTRMTSLDTDFRYWGDSNTAPLNWTGGDATYSVGLPDGRVAWFFADSFHSSTSPTVAGYVLPDHSRYATITTGSGTYNQMVIQDPTVIESPTAHEFTNVWPAGAPGTTLFPGPDGSHKYWPLQPFLANSTTIRLPLARVTIAGGVPDGLAVVDITIGTWAQSAITPVPTGFVTKSNCVNGQPNVTVEFGESVLVNPDGSGNTYLYGTEPCFGGLKLHVAKLVGGSDLTVGSAWRFWDGTVGGGWQTTSTTLGDVKRTDGTSIGDAGHELSVVRTSTGYRMINTLDSINQSILLSTATSANGPTGPFTLPTTIYTTPEQGGPDYNNTNPDCRLQTYNAKEHPELEATGQLVFTYNVLTVNGGNGTCNSLTELNHQVDNYRPRFIKMPAP